MTGWVEQHQIKGQDNPLVPPRIDKAVVDHGALQLLQQARRVVWMSWIVGMAGYPFGLVV